MTLKEKINTDFISALKQKNAPLKSLLSVVRGEIQNTEKNIMVESLNDEDVLKILNKTAKSLNETISLLAPSGHSENLTKAIYELGVIKSYLPKQMSKEEITSKVKQLVDIGITNIGSIMKEFATLQADKKIVSETIKEVIK